VQQARQGFRRQRQIMRIAHIGPDVGVKLEIENRRRRAAIVRDMQDHLRAWLIEQQGLKDALLSETRNISPQPLANGGNGFDPKDVEPQRVVEITLLAFIGTDMNDATRVFQKAGHIVDVDLWAGPKRCLQPEEG